jgi:hypothetical protein
VVKGWAAWWAREQQQFWQRGITDQELTADTVSEAVEKVFGKTVQVTEWGKASDDSDG